MDISKFRPAYSLRALVSYFFKLGSSGFGGPVALVGYMHRDLVEKKKWISEEEYKEGLALAQLAPGPLAAQLSIYLGFVHYGVLGATLTGIAFIIPSFIMVIILGAIYKSFGGIVWMQAVFYGVGAAVVGIIGISAYKLTVKAISKFNFREIKKHWILWLFFIVSAIVTIKTHSENIILLIAAGFINVLVKVKPIKIPSSNNRMFVFLSITFGGIQTFKLTKLGLFFLKAGAFVFGSGLAIVPFLRSGVVEQFGWLTEQEFLDAVAVAMITPGPVVITVGFIGYLVSGLNGAIVAAAATFLPCYLLTILPAPHFKKISKNESVKTFVEGITAAVVGALAGAVVVIGINSISDIPTALIALGSGIVLLLSKKLKEPAIVLIGAVVGLLLKFVW